MDERWELSDHDRQTLELLGESFIPQDGRNDGLEEVGFSGIIELRNKYQPALAKLYSIGLNGIDQISMSLHNSTFSELPAAKRNEVIACLLADDPPSGVWTDLETPRAFFENLKMDACFVYGTSEDVWEQIGFDGPSYNSGGHPDYDQPQG